MHSTKRIYFPNLNGLRFIAAFAVIIHHIEQLKSIFNINSLWNSKGLLPSVIHSIGSLGVVLFFVLSGFLITYLLLAEEEKTKTIAIKKFYIRRILRIWPLYLLIVLSSLFILPHINILLWPGYSLETTQAHLGWKLLLYLFFFANLVLSMFGVIPFASQTWSVGTEEQFYFVWPVIVKYIKKHRALLFIAIIVAYNLCYLFINTPHSNFVPYKHVIKAFVNGFAIDNMAIGGLIAYCLYKNKPILKYIVNIYTFILALGLIVGILIHPIFTPYINHVKFPILFAVLIVNLAANPALSKVLEHKALNYLGSISYGLYMFHPIAVTIAIKMAIYNHSQSNYIIYPISIVLSILISAISLKYFENNFLKLKHKFSIIKSGSKE